VGKKAALAVLAAGLHGPYRPFFTTRVFKTHSTEVRVWIDPMPDNTTKAPTIDSKAWQRNKTTAWLEFVDRLSSWLWQDNEGAARWAFGSIYKTIINAHPNTEALDVVPFGTNLLRAIGAKIVPEDAEGVTHANLELQRQIYTFPGLACGIEPLRGWC